MFRSGDDLEAMSMSDSEQRRWTELEAELKKDRRLAALSRRLDVMPSRTVVLGWAIGGILGLVFAVCGFALHNGTMLAAAAVTLTTTIVVNGVALIAVGVSDMRRHHRKY
jgi:uncharacterized membrane protein